MIDGLFRAFFLLAVCAAAVPAAARTPESADRPPNIVLFFVDDMGYGDIGAYGNARAKTPHLDRLAQDGIRFTEFYAAASICTPSRAALLTGRYPIRTGMTAVTFPDTRTGLPADEITIPEILEQRGYRSGLFGKWHLGHLDAFLPTAQGFDVFNGSPFSNDMSVYPRYQQTRIVEPDPDQRYLTRTYTDAAINFIRGSGDWPFFAMIAYPMPHIPLFASPEFLGKSGAGLYGDVIMELDDGVGRVRTALDRLGIADDTIVLFLSDNGPWLEFAAHSGSAGPLRQGKFSAFEGGFRVPALVAWPGRIAPGQTRDGIFSTLDLLPTFAALTGAALPADRAIDGQDIGIVLAGSPMPGERSFAYFKGRRIAGFRRGDWKLLLPDSGSNEKWLAIGWPGSYPAQPLQLFNLREDPGETRNLADANPGMVARLRAAIAAFEAGMGPVRPAFPLRDERAGPTGDFAGAGPVDQVSHRYRDAEIARRKAALAAKRSPAMR